MLEISLERKMVADRGGGYLVRMKDIQVQFGNVVALDRVSFEIGHNEIVGLLGENGAGKSTLVNALIGEYQMRGGEIFFDGRKGGFTSPGESRRAGIETVYQNLALVDDLSIAKNFFLGRETVHTVGPLHVPDEQRMNEATEWALRDMGFHSIPPVTKNVSALSGGERQSVAIGRAFHFARKLLILDEPTAALSEADIETVLRLIKRAKQRGISVVFITHKAHEVFEVADRFVVLHRGRKYAELNTADTDLRQLEKLLISSRLAAVREMAAAVAHQIRNPLGILRVSMEMLRDDFQAASNQDNYLRIIETVLDEVNALGLVVSNFLSFARQPALNRKTCAVKELVYGSLGCLPLDHFPGVRIHTAIEDGVPSLYIDKSLMEQAIANLVINALQASPTGGTVDITCRQQDGKLCIEVRDEGPGMDEETVRKIFNPFFTTKPSGTGLGLSIVHKILEQHNGSIEVHSVQGEGTTFRLFL
ncbi:MAG: ATP-binding cassette domain-containing protein [Spirochaetota bacterium]